MPATTPNLALPYPLLPDAPADIETAVKPLALKLDALYGSTGATGVLYQKPVLDVGLLNQVRAGRQLTVADFTSMGLMQPVGLWNLGDLTNLGTGGALTNKGSVPFGVGINGAAATSAVFSGSTAQALYIVDTGATDPYRIRWGSFGAWSRTAKRAVQQHIVAKSAATAGQYGWMISVNTTAELILCFDGTNTVALVGVSDITDDRWHHVVATYDGTLARLYVDGVLEGTASWGFGAIFGSSTPLNVGSKLGDSGVAASSPHYGRVDEAFVTPDVLSDDQIRLLYCAKIPHGYSVTPSRVTLNVRRQRRGGAFTVADFPSQPVRLHNFTAAALTDQGSGGVALTNNNPTLILPVAGADGDGETPNTSGNAFSFSGAHTGLSSTDAGLPAGTAARSYGCWFKTTTAAGNISVISWGTQGANYSLIYVSVGAIACVSGADNIAGPFTADGQWHLITCTEDNAAGDGVKRKLYLDGRLVGGSTVLNSLTLAGANRFRVGANPDGTSPFTGQIDGAFVHSVALTMEQIAALWAKGTQGLGASPKEPGAHVELMDGSNVLATFDQLESTALVDLGVAA